MLGFDVKGTLDFTSISLQKQKHIHTPPCLSLVQTSYSSNKQEVGTQFLVTSYFELVSSVFYCIIDESLPILTLSEVTLLSEHLHHFATSVSNK